MTDASAQSQFDAHDPAGKRLALLSLQEESEGEGQLELAEAYHRVVLLTEVLECLTDDHPAIAGEIARFCSEAYEALHDASNDVDAERAASWVLRESSSALVRISRPP